MSIPAPAGPSLRTAVVLSAALHLGLLLVPGVRGIPGDGAPAAVAEPGFLVSLFEIPDPESPPSAVEPPATVPAEPATEPVPEPASSEPERSAAPPEARPAHDPGSAPAAGEGSVEGEATEAGTGEGSDVVRYRPPRLLAGALPIDPEDSGKLDVPDEIPVRLRIGTDGRVLEVVPEDPDLSPPVREALNRSARAMRFSPARRGTQAVEAWFSMTFVFRR